MNGRDVTGEWRNDQLVKKHVRWNQRQLSVIQLMLCVSVSLILCCLSQKRKACLKVSLRQSTKVRKVNHSTSSVFLPGYAIYAQVTHTACVWFAWERGMRRRLSRGLIGHTERASLYIHKRSPRHRPRFCWGHTHILRVLWPPLANGSQGSFH